MPSTNNHPVLNLIIQISKKPNPSPTEVASFNNAIHKLALQEKGFIEVFFSAIAKIEVETKGKEYSFFSGGTFSSINRKDFINTLKTHYSQVIIELILDGWRTKDNENITFHIHNSPYLQNIFRLLLKDPETFTNPTAYSKKRNDPTMQQVDSLENSWKEISADLHKTEVDEDAKTESKDGSSSESEDEDLCSWENEVAEACANNTLNTISRTFSG